MDESAAPTPLEYGGAWTSPDDVRAVQAIYAAFARGDVEDALTHIAADVLLHIPETARRSGRTGPYAGHAGVREYFGDIGRVWEDLRLHADDVRSARGGVVVFGRVTGRLPDGPLAREVLWVWQVRDGKATSVRVSDLRDLPEMRD